MDWIARINALLGDGYTVATLAAEIGVTPNAVREILAGRTKSPRASAALRLLAINSAFDAAGNLKDEQEARDAA